MNGPWYINAVAGIPVLAVIVAIIAGVRWLVLSAHEWLYDHVRAYELGFDLVTSDDIAIGICLLITVLASAAVFGLILWFFGGVAIAAWRHFW